jgi:Phage late-transcription coactivator
MPTKDEIKQFSLMIEDLARKLECNHMDAIVHHCQETGFEIEVASTLVSPKLKNLIRDEAVSLNLLKKEGSRLPI